MKTEKITNSKFVKVKCPKCNKEQVLFGKATTTVYCNECKNILAKPSGGKVKIRAKVLEVLQ